METQNANVIKGEAKSIEPREYNTEAIKRRRVLFRITFLPSFSSK